MKERTLREGPEGTGEGSARGARRADADLRPGGDQPGAQRTPEAEPELLSVRGTRSAGTADHEQASSDEPVLVLTSPSGQVFHLPVDGSLRAAVRSASAPPQAPTGTSAARLRPKDIQARIRGGESAEEVADAAEVPLDTVERYAGPVLAERAHVATLARATVVRTARSRPSLEDLVRHRLASRGVALDGVTWDAWRRGEAGWVLQVGFRAGTRDRVAQWRYDPSAEHVEPLDDEARWLSSSHEAETGPRNSRLSAVRVFDVEADGGLDQERPDDTGPLPPTLSPSPPELAGDAGADARPGSGPAADDDTADDHDEVAARTMDLLDALSDRRGRRQPMTDLDMDDLDDDASPLDDITDAPGAPGGTGGEDGGLGPGYGSGFPAHMRGGPGAKPPRSTSHLRSVAASVEDDAAGDGDGADGPGLVAAPVDADAGTRAEVDTTHEIDAVPGADDETDGPTSSTDARWWQRPAAVSPAAGTAEPPEPPEPSEDPGPQTPVDDAPRESSFDGAPALQGVNAFGLPTLRADGDGDADAPRTVGASWAARGGLPEQGSIGGWIGPSTPIATPAPPPGAPSPGEPAASGDEPVSDGASDDGPAGRATAKGDGAGRGRRSGAGATPARAGTSRSRGGRRSSVPSWDEIVFGSPGEQPPEDSDG